MQYVSLADWMWLHEKWCVRKLAFAPGWAPEETLVIMPTKESWGLFTYEEVQKICTVHPLNGFVDEPVQGKVFCVEFKEMEAFLRGQFYHTILKAPKAGTLLLVRTTWQRSCFWSHY